MGIPSSGDVRGQQDTVGFASRPEQMAAVWELAADTTGLDVLGQAPPRGRRGADLPARRLPVRRARLPPGAAAGHRAHRGAGRGVPQVPRASGSTTCSSSTPTGRGARRTARSPCRRCATRCSACCRPRTSSRTPRCTTRSTRWRRSPTGCATAGPTARSCRSSCRPARSTAWPQLADHVAAAPRRLMRERGLALGPRRGGGRVLRRGALRRRLQARAVRRRRRRGLLKAVARDHDLMRTFDGHGDARPRRSASSRPASTPRTRPSTASPGAAASRSRSDCCCSTASRPGSARAA